MKVRVPVAANLTSPMSRPSPLSICCAVTAAGFIAGCLSPERAARDADATAYDIIAEKQLAALGEVQPFTIDELEDQLRRKLMIEQKLPAGDESSYGRLYLQPVPKQPPGISEGLPLPDGSNVVAHRELYFAGLNTPVLSFDAALVDVGAYPSPTNQAAELPSATDERLVLVVPPERPPLVLSLVDALTIAAKSSRQYQDQKERVYLAALALDLRRDRFETQFGAGLGVDAAADLEGDDVAGVVVSPSLDVGKLFKNGVGITGRIGIDLARLLSGDGGESLGTFADVSMTVPLLAGAGVEVVAEPLQQAERDAVYAIWSFERFKREFAVDIVSDYFGVLVSRDQITNAAGTLRRLSVNVARSQALYDEGELPSIQLDRVRSQQLRAEIRLISAQQRYQSQLDRFNITLGLPTDARLELSDEPLQALVDEADAILGRLDSATRGVEVPDVETLVDPDETVDVDVQPDGPTTAATTSPALPADTYEPQRALREAATRLAIRRRLDLATSYGRVIDAQRQTVVAADGLNGVLDLTANANYGGGRGTLSGGLPDSSLDFTDGRYGAGLRLDLPIERTAERNAYRTAIIRLEQAIRDAQQAEDFVKLDIANALRRLQTAAQSVRIQYEAIRVAQRRLDAANELVELGRGNTRDITEAEDDLTDAQDDFTQSLVDYRLAELELQRDTGVLQVTAEGLLEEVDLFDLPSAGDAPAAEPEISAATTSLLP